jgi:hypothetical protein
VMNSAHADDKVKEMTARFLWADEQVERIRKIKGPGSAGK